MTVGALNQALSRMSPPRLATTGGLRRPACRVRKHPA